jgi:hypothetical protein
MELLRLLRLSNSKQKESKQRADDDSSNIGFAPVFLLLTAPYLLLTVI